MKLALASLFLAASVPASAAGDDQMLDAFRAACERVDDAPSMRADALGSGWEEIAESADPRLERLVRLGREAVGEVAQMSGATFRRRHGDRQLFLIQSRFVDADGIWGNGCRLYDFDASASLDAAILGQWMARAPTGVEGDRAAAYKLLWEPGWRDGVTVEVAFVPQDSPLRERFGLSGNILVAQAIGGF